MKIDKKKIVFASVVVIALIFIVSYTMLVFLGEKTPENLEQPSVPELEEAQENYTTRMEAIEALKEEQEQHIPSIYPEELLDSLGWDEADVEELQPSRKGDSLPKRKVITNGTRHSDLDTLQIPSVTPKPAYVQDFVAGHLQFFQAGTNTQTPVPASEGQQMWIAAVNGKQTVRSKDRLELVLKEPVTIEGEVFPQNTPIYGFVSIQPNRLFIQISHLGRRKVNLKVFDLQDSNEGIYIRNSFRSEATKEVLDDMVQDIAIPGLPQVQGVKNIFRRNNRNIKVTIMDQYQLILKQES